MSTLIKSGVIVLLERKECLLKNESQAHPKVKGLPLEFRRAVVIAVLLREWCNNLTTRKSMQWASESGMLIKLKLQDSSFQEE